MERGVRGPERIHHLVALIVRADFEVLSLAGRTGSSCVICVRRRSSCSGGAYSRTIMDSVSVVGGVYSRGLKECVGIGSPH